MFPTDIILNISKYLSYSDYISLISTCSDYYNNEYIRSSRRNEKIDNADVIFLNKMLYLAISINDTEMLKLIFERCSTGKQLVMPREPTDAFIKLLVNRSTPETFKFIIKNVSVNFYLPEVLSNNNSYYIGDRWSYMANIIERDRDDIMTYFLEKYITKDHDFILILLTECVKHLSLKNIAVLLKDKRSSQLSNKINDIILKEFENDHIEVVETFIKNYTDITSTTVITLLSYDNITIRKCLLDTLGY